MQWGGGGGGGGHKKRSFNLQLKVSLLKSMCHREPLSQSTDLNFDNDKRNVLECTIIPAVTLDYALLHQIHQHLYRTFLAASHVMTKTPL